MPLALAVRRRLRLEGGLLGGRRDGERACDSVMASYGAWPPVTSENLCGNTTNASRYHGSRDATPYKRQQWNEPS